jgi:hypothetical protein
VRHIGICVEAVVTVAVLGAWVQVAASLSDASLLDGRACPGTMCVKVPSEPCRSAGHGLSANSITVPDCR